MSKFPYGCADVAKESGGKESNVYEVNQWLWRFVMSKPRLGGLSVSVTEERRMAVMQEGARRDHVTGTKRRPRRDAPKAETL